MYERSAALLRSYGLYFLPPFLFGLSPRNTRPVTPSAVWYTNAPPSLWGAGLSACVKWNTPPASPLCPAIHRP
jgi:hypothetical protein